MRPSSISSAPGYTRLHAVATRARALLLICTALLTAADAARPVHLMPHAGHISSSLINAPQDTAQGTDLVKPVGQGTALTTPVTCQAVFKYSSSMKVSGDSVMFTTSVYISAKFLGDIPSTWAFAGYNPAYTGCHDVHNFELVSFEDHTFSGLADWSGAESEEPAVSVSMTLSSSANLLPAVFTVNGQACEIIDGDDTESMISMNQDEFVGQDRAQPRAGGVAANRGGSSAVADEDPDVAADRGGSSAVADEDPDAAADRGSISAVADEDPDVAAAADRGSSSAVADEDPDVAADRGGSSAVADEDPDAAANRGSSSAVADEDPDAAADRGGSSAVADEDPDVVTDRGGSSAVADEDPDAAADAYYADYEAGLLAQQWRRWRASQLSSQRDVASPVRRLL